MSSSRFPDLPSGYPFPALEREVLEDWRRDDVFRKTLEHSAGKPTFVFFEGPPTANNKPHVGHVVGRVIKDIFPRFRTMRGFHVPRKAGWDTHGLPVEIEVEKRLGFSGKKQIEEYGIAEFNRACLESVQLYEQQWRAMTERIGYWVDLDDAYLTYTNDYIESVWWALAELANKGLLEQGYKIQPYCARCGTTLSSHEVAQNYKDTDDPSVWAMFPARPGQPVETVDGERWTFEPDSHFVAWTTTPWTLLAHVGLAVHPELTYRLVEHPDPERAGVTLIFAEELDKPVPLELTLDGKRRRLDLREQPALARFSGRVLEGIVYDRPFRFGPFDFDNLAPTAERAAFARPEAATAEDGWQAQDAHGWRVLLADYVTTSDGTGIVHTAPPFGEDDYRSGRSYGLPGFMAVTEAGTIDPRAEPFAGQWFKDADPEILRDLKGRGLLLHSERYTHSYPFCWRCDRPLLYYATTSWFVRTTERQEELIARNREIAWHPQHVGEGRFGNWLENMVDWAVSRSRYWGTPLPIWLCDSEGCDQRRVIGSYAELFEAAGRPLPADPYDPAQFDPHRPAIDEITWPCSQCGGTLRRVEEVIDAWFDSGSMPFAQHHYPFENRELLEAGSGQRQFPADFIAEGVDQTRGWFYTLHVLGSLLFDSIAYKNCLVIGHISDETGRKMSKRLGNVVDPMEMVEETGADALRWYFCVTNPMLTSRFSARLVRESAQNFLLPLWNALSFFTIYANLDGWRPGAHDEPAFDQRPALDRWVLLRLGRLVEDTTAHLDNYRIPEAARGIEQFVDDLTNWYIRRSRDRFWAGDDTAEATDGKQSGYQALYEVLTTLARLLAPMTPFVAEVLHRHLVRSANTEAAISVHLESWPAAAAGRADQALEAGMAAAQRIVSLGHAARNTHNLKTRQPLAAVTLVTADPDLRHAVEPYAALVREELNVHDIRWAEQRVDYVHHDVKPVYPKCGPRFGKRMKEVAAALAAADGDALAAELESAGKLTITLAEGPEELSSEEVEIRLIEREGTATQGDRELLVALDTALSPELVDEGRAREVVHRISNLRKLAQLDYADRIRVRYHADVELERAIDAFRDWIAGETLALQIAPAASTDGLASEPIDELAFALAIQAANPTDQPEQG